MIPLDSSVHSELHEFWHIAMHDHWAVFLNGFRKTLSRASLRELMLEEAHETKYMKKKKKDKQNLASRWKRVGLVTLHQPLLSSSCWPVAAWAAPGTPSPGYNAGP